MAQYDGSIRINTKIDSKEASAQLMTLENHIIKTADKISALRSKMDALKDSKIPTQEYSEITAQIQKAEAEFNRLLEKQDQMQHEGKDNGSAWDRLNQKMEEVSNTIRFAKGELQDLVDTGKAFTTGNSTEEYKKLGQQLSYAENDLAALSQQYDERTAKLKEQEAEEQRLAQIRENAVVGNQQIIQTLERIKQLEQEIADLKKAGITEGYQDFDSRIQELSILKQEVRDYSNRTAEMQEKYVRLGDSVKQAFKTMGKGIIDIPVAAVKSGAKGLISIFQKLGGVVKKIATGSFKLLGNVGKSVFSLLNKSSSKSTGLMGTLASRFEGLALSLLIFNQISKAFNALISGIKQGFENMYREVDSFKSAVDGLKASSLTLKNSFAAAFRPLVEFAIPYIQKTMDALTSLMDMVGQFTAAITGQKTYTKAIKQTTAAIEDENAAQNKQLSGLDKLNNLSSGSGGSADSGASTQMFEENVPIKSSFLDMYENIKALVENQDWEGFGAYIAGALNQGLQKIYDVINWENVGPRITYFVTAFTQSFNSIVNNLDWDLLGRTIGAGINTIVNTLYLLISGIDWVNLGAKLAEGLNGLVKEVDATKIGNLIGEKLMMLPRILLGFVSNLDWATIGTQLGNALNGVVSAVDLSQIGELLGKSLTGIFQMAINFAATFDWAALGTNIYQGINAFFMNTDWATVGQGISDFVMGLLDTILVAVQGIDWAEVGRSIVEFILGIDWIGLAGKLIEIGVYLIDGLLEGILAALSSIGTWIKENVFDPIVEWFKTLFGIHSPSTVMEEQGNFLMLGLFNGISSLVQKVISVFSTIKEKIIGIWNSVKEKTKGIWEGIKNVIRTPINAILGFVESLANGVINAINFAIGALNNLSFDIPDWVPGLGGKTFGFNIPELSQVSIPRLATGTVVPPNREFMAVLGDNKREPEVVSPISTMKQANKEAIMEVLSELGLNSRNSKNGGNETFVFQVDGNTFFEITRKKAQEYFDRTGRPAYPI